MYKAGWWNRATANSIFNGILIMIWKLYSAFSQNVIMDVKDHFQFLKWVPKQFSTCLHKVARVHHIWKGSPVNLGMEGDAQINICSLELESTKIELQFAYFAQYYCKVCSNSKTAFIKYKLNKYLFQVLQLLDGHDRPNNAMLHD